MKSAVVYSRVSTAGQEEKGASLESQEAACIKRAEELGYAVARQEREIFTRSLIFERPLLSSIRDEIRQGKYDAFVVYAIDRLASENPHLFLLIDEFERFGVKFICVTEEFENTAVGQMILSVRGFAAKVEREKIRERSMRGKLAKATKGTLSTNQNVLGYEYNPITKRREINESEAEIVRKIFNAALAGRTIGGIAHELDLLGIPSPKNGQCWLKCTVRYILKNPVYIGKVYVSKSKSIQKFDKQGKRVNTRVERLQHEWLLQNADIEPLVTEQEFEEVQKIISHNRTSRRGQPLLDFLLRGKIVCDKCERIYTTTHGKGYRGYLCDSKKSPLTKCGNPSLNARKAEAFVWNHILDLMRNPQKMIGEMQAACSKDSVQQNKLKSDLQSVSASIAKAEKELKTLASRIATVDDNLWDIIQTQLTEKQNQIAQLKQMRLDCESSLNAFASQTFDPKLVVEYCNQFAADAENYSFDERVKLINFLGIRLRWNGETLKMRVGMRNFSVVSYKQLTSSSR